jgi:hypothetical protein
MNQAQLSQIKNWRPILDNEIVIEYDDSPNSWEAINGTGINLFKDGFAFEIWYAKGQRSCHIHIKNLEGFNVSDEARPKAKELFILKYVPEKHKPFVDLKMSEAKRLIAEENKLHFKYHTIKKLLGEFNQGHSNIFPKYIIQEAEESLKEKHQRKVSVVSSGITAEIIKKVSIIDLAKRRYKLDVDARGLCVCPFHNDNDPSLKFYDEQGKFCCFGRGCDKKGNIIDFIKYMEELKNG